MTSPVFFKALVWLPVWLAMAYSAESGSFAIDHVGLPAALNMNSDDSRSLPLQGMGGDIHVPRDTEAFATELLRKIRSDFTEQRQRDLQEPTTDYVDFSKLLDPNYLDEDDFYAMLGSLLQQGKAMINGNVANGDDPLLINTLMTGLLTSSDSNRTLTFRWEIPNGGYELELPGINPVLLTAVHIGGLDTFTMVSILNPTDDDPQTIQNTVGMDVLTLDLEMTEMTGENGEKTDSVIGLAFQDVTISVPLVLAVDQTALGEFPVGALLYSQYLMACLNVAVDTIEIASLDMEFGTIERPTTSSPTASAVFQLIQTVFVTVPATVPAFFDAILRPIINNMLQNNAEGNSALCPSSENATFVNEFVDLHEIFQQGLPSILKSFIDSQILAVDPATGLSAMNSMFIEPWTFNQSGVEGMMMFGGVSSTPMVDFNSGISIGGLEADIQLRVDNITIRNLNTIMEPLALLTTTARDPHLLNNTATMGLKLDNRPLSLSTAIFLSIDSGGRQTNSVLLFATV
jgi:hypothetical protein